LSEKCKIRVMAVGYRLVIREGGEHEDRSVAGYAGLEPDKPALSESEANKLKGVLGGRIESFESKFVMPEIVIKNERVAS